MALCGTQRRRPIKSAEVVFTNWRVQIAGRNTTDKPADHSATGRPTMNISSLSYIKIQTHLRDTGNSFGPMERIMDTWRFVKKGKLTNSLQKFYIYSETIRNNQINEESTVGCHTIYNALTQHEHDRCGLSARPLPVAPHMAAGNHHLRPYRGPQFPTEIQRGKLKDLAPRHVQHTKHRTVQLRTVTAADDRLMLEGSFRIIWLLYFIFYMIYIHIKNVKKRWL